MPKKYVSEKVLWGLHPESLVWKCDYCHTRNGEEIVQQGRFMTHLECYEKTKHFISWQHQPLDYGEMRRFKGDSDLALYDRMVGKLRIERREKINTLQIAMEG